MMLKYLIIGGSGFIGTNLINRLLNDGISCIMNIDCVSPKVDDHKAYWRDQNICDRENLLKLVADFSPDYVIHLAARTDLRGESLNDYAANTDGVQNLLDALEQVPNLKRVIFASSMYVCIPGYIPRNFDDYAPHTLYGESKVITEKLIKKRNPQYTWSIIRPTSIWGPYFGEPYDKFFKIVLSHSYFHLGKRACKKTYGYVDNTVYQIMSLLEADSEKVNRRVFYLGDYEAYDITEWANEIASCVEIKIPTVPFFLFRLAAFFGDCLKKIGFVFPMTSFRLKNMTTDNVHDLSLIKEIAPNLPVKRIEGTKRTIKWLKGQ